jgi:hypothetical protein
MECVFIGKWQSLMNSLQNNVYTLGSAVLLPRFSGSEKDFCARDR